MSIDKLKKFSKVSVDFIFALLIVLSCGSIYDNFTNINLYISELFMAILFIKVAILTITKIKEQKKENIKKIIIFSVIYIIYQLIYVGFHMLTQNVGTSIITYMAKLVMIFLLLIFYYILENDDEKLNNVLRNISNIVLIISSISICFFLFGSILHWVKHTNVVELTFGFTREINSYFMIYFEPQYTFSNGTYIIRNCGIFSEAPMYSIVLLMSFAYETLLSKNKRNYKLIILFTTILTTMSTIGIVVATLLLVIYIIRLLLSKHQNVNKKLIFRIATIVIIIGLIVGSVAIIDKLKSPSFSIRMDDYVASFKAWVDSPILGNGYQNYEAVEQYFTVDRESGGQSSSLSNLLVEGGIWIFAIYIIPFAVLLKRYIKNRDLDRIIFIITVFVIFSTIIFTYSLMILLFISYGWYKVIFDKEEKKEHENIYSNT